MASRMPLMVLCVLAVLAQCGMDATAGTLDPHRIYEQRCAGCHGPHAGDFVSENLDAVGDRLYGRKTGREVRAFLNSGHGGVRQGEIDALAGLFEGIRRSGRLFRQKCLICHDRAVILARRELVIRNGRLVGEYTDRDIAHFLLDHGRLDGDEVARMVEMLNCQLQTQASDTNSSATSR